MNKKNNIIIFSIILLLSVSFLVSAQENYNIDIDTPEKSFLEKLFPTRTLSFFDTCSRSIGYKLIQLKNDGSKKSYNINQFCSDAGQITLWRGSPSNDAYPSHLSKDREFIETLDIYPNTGFSWSCDAGAYWNNDCYIDVVCCQEQKCTKKDVCPSGKDCNLINNHYYWCDSLNNKKRVYTVQQTDCSLVNYGQTSSNEVCINGKFVKESMCTDSDGRDYRTKGTVTTTYLGNQNKDSDSCASEIEVYERICENDWIGSIKFNCKNLGNNYKCQDGKCAEVSTGTCTDSDGGKNINTKGSISGKYGTGESYSMNDYCSVTDKSKVSEVFCINPDTGVLNGNHPNSEWINCPIGTVCLDGACIKESSETQCVPQGGECQEICDRGEIWIGILDCTGNDYCCREGELGSCPEDKTKPYCSDVKKDVFYVCEGGLTNEYDCEGDSKCTDGDACYGYYKRATSLLGKIANSIKDKIGSKEGDCKNCDSYAYNILLGSFMKDLQCTPRLLALPPQTTSTCIFSFFKIFLVPIAFVFGSLIFSNILLKFQVTKKNKLLRGIISIGMGIFLAYIGFLFWWLVLLILIGLVLFKIFL